MIQLLVAAAAVAAQPNRVPAAVGGLMGCWKVAGQVRGKDATSIARGDWHLGRRYFVLHLRSVPPAQPYEAAIYYGAGEKTGAVGSFWMDTFGGLYEPSMGLGAVTSDGFSVDYRFPDSVYTNHFRRVPSGWTWTIVEKASRKPGRLFAEYRLTGSGCAGMRFGF
jgi:hypothetical protein